MQNEVEIKRITPFATQDGHGRAAVTLRCGPVIVHAKLFEKDGSRWLSMPARKDAHVENKWHDLVYFERRDDHRQVESEVIRQFDRMMHMPEEVVRTEEPAYAAMAM